MPVAALLTSSRPHVLTSSRPHVLDLPSAQLLLPSRAWRGNALQESFDLGKAIVTETGIASASPPFSTTSSLACLLAPVPSLSSLQRRTSKHHTTTTPFEASHRLLLLLQQPAGTKAQGHRISQLRAGPRLAETLKPSNPHNLQNPAVMSRFWPHTAYAEDQPFPRTILTVHVYTRALTMGSLIGPAIATPIFLLRRWNVLKPALHPQNFPTVLVRSAGFGGAIAMGLMCVALPGRMWGREEIEWKDRSWRLLENKGQVETDDWTYGGMVLGGLAGLRLRGLGWRGALGSTGLGSVAGMLGFLGWRHGVNGGKFDGSEV